MMDLTQIREELIKSQLEKPLPRAKLNRDYDIPYLAGYSKDAKTVYIHRDMPKGFKTKSGKFVETDKYLMMHEEIEKTLEDRFGLKYEVAHRIATAAERAAVEKDGISWKEYSAFMAAWIEHAEKKKDNRLPPDLDKTPYKD